MILKPKNPILIEYETFAKMLNSHKKITILKLEILSNRWHIGLALHTATIWRKKIFRFISITVKGK